MSIDLVEIEQRLAQLREEWRAHPDKRPVILLQAKALQRAREIALSKAANEAQDLFEVAKRIFS